MKPFPLCISNNCPVSQKCERKLNGDESKKVDYAKVDMGNNDKCVWYIEVVEMLNEIKEDDNGE